MSTPRAPRVACSSTDRSRFSTSSSRSSPSARSARNAPVLALVTEGDRSLDGVATDVFVMPAVEEAASVILNTVMLQLFAYRIGVKLGQDVDQPRNLAKSVTVE